jgi:hypothetical protein
MSGHRATGHGGGPAPTAAAKEMTRMDFSTARSSGHIFKDGRGKMPTQPIPG